MNENEIREIVRSVLAQTIKSTDSNSDKAITVEASARHVHLCKNDVEALFGKGAVLTKKRDLSQPGEFLSEQRVRLVTPKGEIKNVAVLGPERKSTQVELSVTDIRQLGLDAPVNLSGDLEGAEDVLIFSDKSFVVAKESVIVAKNHIHMTPKDAENFGVKDSQHVKVRVDSKRPVTFDDVVIRVNENFSLAMHIDFDEANACLLEKDTKGYIV